jgi:hypothetical protein
VIDLEGNGRHSQEVIELRLYQADSEVALMNGADKAVEFDDLAAAVAHWHDLLELRLYGRAIVVEVEDPDDEDGEETELYDSKHDESLNPQPLPAVAAPGPRLRVSPLAERDE